MDSSWSFGRDSCIKEFVYIFICQLSFLDLFVSSLVLIYWLKLMYILFCIQTLQRISFLIYPSCYVGSSEFHLSFAEGLLLFRVYMNGYITLSSAIQFKKLVLKKRNNNLLDSSLKSSNNSSNPPFGVPS